MLGAYSLRGQMDEKQVPSIRPRREYWHRFSTQKLETDASKCFALGIWQGIPDRLRWAGIPRATETRVIDNAKLSRGRAAEGNDKLGKFLTERREIAGRVHVVLDDLSHFAVLLARRTLGKCLVLDQLLAQSLQLVRPS